MHGTLLKYTHRGKKDRARRGNSARPVSLSEDVYVSARASWILRFSGPLRACSQIALMRLWSAITHGIGAVLGSAAHFVMMCQILLPL